MESDECDNSVNCPLCLEQLDQTDLSLKPCLCGYQVCLYCLHYIREQQDGKCPACRTPYTEENFSITKLEQDGTKRFHKRMNRKKEGIQGREWSSPKTNITHRGPCPRQLSPNNSKRLRIIQRNLICVKNLTASLCRADVLRREDLFGRFGELLRVLVDKGRWSSSVRVPTKSWDNNVVYILYETETAAANAVKAMHNQVVYDKKIQVSLATTKYCNAFLESGKSQWCDNPYCLYRHETANPEDVVTVDALHSLGLAPPPPHYLFSVKKSRSHSIPPGYYPNSHKPSVYEDSLHSLENNKKFGTNTDSPTSSGWSRSLDSDEPFYLDDNLMEDECNNNKKKNVWDIQNGYWNTTLEPLSSGNYIETASMLSINGELPPLSEWILLGGNVADMSQSPGLDMYHSKNRMSSRFDFHSEEEEHVSDEESLSPELKNKIFATSNPSADSKASKTPTLLENSEWISPEKRLELMFGNDIVNHFVTLDSLPSLNDLLTRLQSSKTGFSLDKESPSNVSENNASLDISVKESSSTVDSVTEERMMEEESKTAQTKNKTVQPNCTNSKKNQRKKKKSKKAKSDSKDSSVASNESLNALDNVQSYSTKDEAISPVEEYPPNAIMKPPQDAYEDSPKTSHCKTTDTRSSETLQKELQAMKEKEWKLQKRLEELQIKLERLMLL